MKKSWSSWVLLFVAAVVLMAGGCGGGGGGDGDNGNNPGPIPGPGPAPGPGPNPEITNVALSNLTISNGILAPVFSSGVTGYTASVGNNVSFITVKPTAASPDDVEITVNDAEVDSGLASEAIALNIGANIISVTVKAFDDPGNTRRYTVTVTRADAGVNPNPANLNLSALSLSSGTLAPAFAPGTTSYTASVEFDTAYIVVTPTAAAPQSVKIKINGYDSVSGSMYGVYIKVGENPLTITVSEAGNTTNAKNYIVTVTRETLEESKPDPIVDRYDPAYGPLPFTQEELDAFVEKANLPLEYEELTMSDGTSIANYISAHTPLPSLAKGDVSTSKIAASQAASIEDVQATLLLMQQRAWELASRGPDTISSASHPDLTTDTNPGGRILQTRYLYVYPIFNEEYGRLDIPIHQYPSKYNKSASPCTHGVQGMDCAGFIYQTALAIGVKDMGGKWGNGPLVQATASTWNKVLNNELVIAEDVTPTGNPEPGDIIAWSNHVGIVVRKNNGEIGVIHSLGVPGYSCADYYAAEQDKRQGKNVANGPKVSRYSDTVAQFGPVARRVHFRVVGGGTTPTPTAPNILWQKSLGGSGNDYAQSIQQTSDGGYIVAGWSDSRDGDVTGNHSRFSYDYWIVKLNSTGGIVWQKSLGGSSYDAAYSTQQTSDGGYIVAGSSTSNNDDVSGNHGYYDYWIVKLK
ncbi:hypothetical protein FACS1894187_01890 [Synergistales bacterium]|nr:hypothetical protein FACS1894187_01890 [Synergistales bacterium]